MATQLQIRRGSAAQVSAFTGAEGEIVVNTTNDSIVVSDGSTAGGFEMARADLNNVSDTDLNAALTGNTVSALTVTTLTAGTVTADGLTVDGDVNIADAVPILRLDSPAVTWSGGEDLGGIDWYTEDTSGNGPAVMARIYSESSGSNTLPIPNLIFQTSLADVSLKDRMKIEGNGDISFYEDTGATPKFFWDASAESLGIGNSSPSSYFSNASNLVVGGTTGANGMTISGSTDTQIFFADGTSGADAYRGIIRYSHADNGFSFWTDGTRRLDIDSSGNVGIGTTSPSDLVTIQSPASGGGNGITIKRNDNGTDQRVGAISFGNTVDTDLAQITVQTSSGNNGDGNLLFHTQPNGGSTTERMRIDSSGNVGIGTSNPIVAGASFTGLAIDGDASSITLTNGSDQTTYIYNSENEGHLSFELVGDMRFRPGSAERARLTSDGNLLVGRTTSGTLTVAGSEFQAGGAGFHIRDGGTALFVGRKTSDGGLVEFSKDGTTVGSIGSEGGDALYIQSGTTSGSGFRFHPTNGAIDPLRNGSPADNSIDLGRSGARFDDIFATNGTIQTSDRNEKQDIEALSDAEQRVAVAAKSLMRKFRWISSVEAKGDDARIHFGIIAQDLEAAFTAEGLDAGRYAMFISSTWTDDDGNEQTRLGVRYSELLAFIISAI